MDIDPTTLASEEFWDERYRSAPTIWSGNPNPHLVTEASALTPSTALDMGAGEGGDAVWLAERGWQVTAADISQVALDRGRVAAEARGAEVAGRISWVHADLTQWQPPVGAFGLVSSHFIHVPSALRGGMVQRCIDAVAVGGTLLIVGHHISDTQTGIRRPKLPDLYFEAEDLAAMLPDGWTVIEAGTRGREVPAPADGGHGHDHSHHHGSAHEPSAMITIHDAVLLARRDR